VAELALKQAGKQDWLREENWKEAKKALGGEVAPRAGRISVWLGGLAVTDAWMMEKTSECWQ
jgi:hypothetical protein